jgi:hypothetical protein
LVQDLVVELSVQSRIMDGRGESQLEEICRKKYIRQVQ